MAAEADEAFKKILEETSTKLEQIKVIKDTHGKERTEDLIQQFNVVINEAKEKFESNAKSEEKDMKKRAKEILKEYLKQISDVQKQGVDALKEMWPGETKSQIQEVVSEQKAKLEKGAKVADLDKIMKEVIKALDNAFGEKKNAINKEAKDAQAKLNEISKPFLK